MCSSLPTLYHERGYTQSLCVVCLGVKHAESALEGAGCPHCERLPLFTLRSSSRREFSLALLTVLAPLPLRRSGSCIRGARNWIWQREWRRAGPYLYPHLPDPLLSGSSPNHVPAPHIGRSKGRALPLVLPRSGTEDNNALKKSRPSGTKPDLRVVLQSRKSSMKRSWHLRPRTVEGGPCWGRVGCTALHGVRLSSAPSGDRSANPARAPGCSGLPRVLLSVLSARNCSRAESLATPSGISRDLQGSPGCFLPALRVRASIYQLQTHQRPVSRDWLP